MLSRRSLRAGVMAVLEAIFLLRVIGDAVIASGFSSNYLWEGWDEGFYGVNF